MTATNAATVSQKDRRGQRRVSDGIPSSVPADQKPNGEPTAERLGVLLAFRARQHPDGARVWTAEIRRLCVTLGSLISGTRGYMGRQFGLLV